MSRSVSGRCQKRGLDLHHDMVLVQRRVGDRNLPLAEGVIEGVVDQLRGDAQARGGVAVDHQRGLQAPVLLVAAHVDQLGQGAQLLQHPRGPG